MSGTSLGIEIGDEVGKQLCRRIFLEDVSGALDPRQPSVRDPVVQPAPVLGRENAVLGPQIRRVGTEIWGRKCSYSAVSAWRIWLY